MRLSVAELAHQKLAAGASLGSAVLARAVAATGRAADEVIFLDFGEVEVATSSFLREGVLGLRDFCHRADRNLTAVVANPNGLVVEELRELLTRLRDAVLCCRLDKKGQPSAPFLVGPLEEAQRETLAAVLAAGVADAATLAAAHTSDPEPKVTKWNNRLAALAAKGILREVRRGRSKSYRPTVEGLTLGP
jgi:hypothetical protein